MIGVPPSSFCLKSQNKNAIGLLSNYLITEWFISHLLPGTEIISHLMWHTVLQGVTLKPWYTYICGTLRTSKGPHDQFLTSQHELFSRKDRQKSLWRLIYAESGTDHSPHLSDSFRYLYLFSHRPHHPCNFFLRKQNVTPWPTLCVD